MPVRVPLKRAQMGVRVGVGEWMAVFLPITCTRGRVLMRVTVPDHNGIKDGYGGACQHDQECQDIQAADRFADDDQGQEGSDKRRHGVIGAGLRRAKVLLRPDILENAQAVGYEAEHQSD